MKKLFVIGLAALLLVVFTMPVMAKVKIGGIIFTDFYYLNRDDTNAGRQGYTGALTGTAIQVPNITRLYGRWTNEDNVGMYIELGIGQNTGSVRFQTDQGDGSVSIRHAYGWWDINPSFQLLAGHTTTPFSPLNPSQLLGTRSGSANIIGIGYGEYYSGRFAQVRGTFKLGKVARIALALSDPHGGAAGPWDIYTNPNTGVTEPSIHTNSKIPLITLGVPIYAGPVHIYPSVLYQHRTIDNPMPSGINNDLDTVVGSLGAKAGFGPFGVSAELNYGQNWLNSRALVGSGAYGNSAVALAAASRNTIDNKINNAKTYGWWVDLNYKFGPVTPHVIIGNMASKRDNAAGISQQASTWMYGVSVPIGLAKGFSIRPELMFYDNGKLEEDNAPSINNGKYYILGVQFQITF
jgi:hypothetical protein